MKAIAMLLAGLMTANAAAPATTAIENNSTRTVSGVVYANDYRNR